ncbi:MAG TPA: aldo/keto reductase [Opitutae bacterium]|nr:aldo/keto reductase [Opitutae bacterium]
MVIRNQRAPMHYRRFGKTDKWLSNITLGGMRYHDGWSGPKDQPSTKMIDQCAEITAKAFECGINHIETAHGYGKSEHCYGSVLNDVLQAPRDSYHFMTKGRCNTAEEMRRTVEAQLAALKLDHIDLYAWHGINTAEDFANATQTGGPVEELHKMCEEGIIGDVGFSTHGRLEIIIDALATDLFSFVNLHYYYFMQRNRGAVDYAAAKDIGVFIISPNDKGGKLYEPSKKLSQLCAPLTPIQFNARWCLAHTQIQTLSFGLSELDQFEEMLGIFPYNVPLSRDDLAVVHRMNGALLDHPESSWDGYEMLDDPSGINIPDILRMRRMWKCYAHTSFPRMRYNMFEEHDAWHPGSFATPEAVAKIDTSKAPASIDIRTAMTEVHEQFYQPNEEGGS